MVVLASLSNPFVSMGAAIRSLALLGQFLHSMGAAIRSLALLGQFLHSMGSVNQKVLHRRTSCALIDILYKFTVLCLKDAFPLSNDNIVFFTKENENPHFSKFHILEWISHIILHAWLVGWPARRCRFSIKIHMP